MVLFLGVALASRGSAQTRPTSPTAAQLRGMIIEDSLTPAKKQLRDFVAELRDTLFTVQAIHARVVRNLATGVTSVVLSDGHALGKRCRVSGAEVDRTLKRVAGMYTSDSTGGQALSVYRAGLAALMEDMGTCQHDDSVMMSASSPDPKRVGEVAAAAADAVTRYDGIRDGLMKLLNIKLPVKGTIGVRGN
jgi:hypothetical protein